jgi:hypothetical protein
MVNIAQKLDRLERLAQEVLSRKEAPVYLREGSEVPEGIDPDRVVWIKRVLLDPPDQPQEELPEITEASPAIEQASPPEFHRQLAVPEQGIL